VCHRKRAGEIKGVRDVLIYIYIWCSDENTDVIFFIKVNEEILKRLLLKIQYRNESHVA